MHRAVFLDRDGVINKAHMVDGKPYPPRNLDELELIPGVDQAILQLRDRGYFCIVVTNQPDVARGKTSKETVESINQFLIQNLAIHEIISCYHDDHDGNHIPSRYRGEKRNRVNGFLRLADGQKSI